MKYEEVDYINEDNSTTIKVKDCFKLQRQLFKNWKLNIGDCSDIIYIS